MCVCVCVCVRVFVGVIKSEGEKIVWESGM